MGSQQSSAEGPSRTQPPQEPPVLCFSHLCAQSLGQGSFIYLYERIPVDGGRGMLQNYITQVWPHPSASWQDFYCCGDPPLSPTSRVIQEQPPPNTCFLNQELCCTHYCAVQGTTLP